MDSMSMKKITLLFFGSRPEGKNISQFWALVSPPYRGAIRVKVYALRNGQAVAGASLDL